MATPVLDRVGGTARALADPQETESVIGNVAKRLDLNMVERWMLGFAVMVSVSTEALSDSDLAELGLHRRGVAYCMAIQSRLPVATLSRVASSLSRKLGDYTKGALLNS